MNFLANFPSPDCPNKVSPLKRMNGTSEIALSIKVPVSTFGGNCVYGGCAVRYSFIEDEFRILCDKHFNSDFRTALFTHDAYFNQP